MKLSGQFQILLRENFATQKTQNKQKATNKNNEVNTKQQRQQFFAHKNFIGGENCLLCVFLYSKFLLKKI